MSLGRAPRYVRQHKRASAAICTAAAHNVAAPLITGSTMASVTVSLGTLSPTMAVPGQESPDVYLSINYTGVGYGSFTYVLAYSPGNGSSSVQSGNVLVKADQPFTYYLYLAPPAGAAASLRVQVYRGNSEAPSALVYQRTIGL